VLNYKCIKRVCLFLISLLVKNVPALSQFHNRPIYDTTKINGIKYYAEIGGLVSSSTLTPFWFRSNQFGTILDKDLLGIFILNARGLWGYTDKENKPYFKVSVESVGAIGKASQMVLPEAYASVNLGHGELYVGRRKEINGLVDTLLTSGSITWSGNAIPITQIRLGTRDFAPLKFTRNLVGINAFYSHGWFANTDSMQSVLLHAKSLFIRIGKPDWKFRFYGGINHFVQWAGYSSYLPEGLAQNGHLASNWRAYGRAVLPLGAPSKDSHLSQIDTLNQVGNHLGSIDFGADIQFKSSNLFIYHQHIFEDNSGLFFKNAPDGLYGVRWKRLSNSSNSFQIKQITIELLTTLNRSGIDPVYGGDDYFYNGQYIGGWMHRGNIIGTPIFTKTVDIPDRIRKNNGWFSRSTGVENFNIDRPVNNSAVETIHLGMYALALQRIPVVLMMTTTKYYEWPENGKSYNQLYTSLEISNISFGFLKGVKAGFKLAYDDGDIFSGNSGVMFKLKKEGFF
jgi:hypothetical protein